jgi:hypothetical protein
VILPIFGCSKERKTEREEDEEMVIAVVGERKETATINFLY